MGHRDFTSPCARQLLRAVGRAWQWAHTPATCMPVQAKHYSRDWIPKGRLRVQLKDAEGKPINPEVPDRK